MRVKIGRRADAVGKDLALTVNVTHIVVLMRARLKGIRRAKSDVV